MSKNLVNQFNLFCKTKNFENNLNQIQLIKTLQQFYNDNFKYLANINLHEIEKQTKNEFGYFPLKDRERDIYF